MHSTRHISLPVSLSLSLSPLIMLSVVSILVVLVILNLLCLKQLKVPRQIKQQQQPEALFQVQQYLHNIETQLKALGRQKDPEIVGETPNITYGVAKKILASGGHLDEVIKTCSLTRGEAELLAAMHKGEKLS